VRCYLGLDLDKLQLSTFSLYMFFPETLHRMADYTKANPNPSITVCEIFEVTQPKYLEVFQQNDTETSKECVTMLQLSTYEHTFVLEALYALGFAIIGMIINYTGKLPIILSVLFTCGSCAISLIFVNIPIVATYLYVVLLACGLAINIVNASTIELYPTNLR
jgi:MFS transporter, VNT family, synaptic vesicle glycoprotein 2